MNRPVMIQYNHSSKEWEALVFIDESMCLMGAYVDINDALDTAERVKEYFKHEGEDIEC